MRREGARAGEMVVRRRTWRGRAVRWALSASVGFAMACGSEDPIAPDATLADLVGQWDALSFIVQSQANPVVAANLIEVGFSFFLDVQPSGSYTAIMTAFGLPQTEFGHVEVRAGSQIVLHREQPGPPRMDAGTFRIAGDTLFLDGETEFDFNQDGAPEPAKLKASLLKR